MKFGKLFLCPFLPAFILVLQACTQTSTTAEVPLVQDTVEAAHAEKDNTNIKEEKVTQAKPGVIETGLTTREELVAFAQTMMGTPYLYASTDPSKGFDCSGFITYVFNHFNIAVPRSSIDFTNVGTEVDTSEALPGDLILFTGTDSTVSYVGHMGIVLSNEEGKLNFIHSSSGKKANGVVITPFERYYRKRFVKIVRVFPD